MRRVALGVLCAGLAGLTASDSTHAQGRGDWTFQRVGTFANYRNVVDATGAVDVTRRTIAEIVAATADGKTLVYTDGERDAIGFIDITDPSQPTAAGSVLLDPNPADGMPYSPTSVAVLRNQYALVAVDNTPPAGTALFVPAGRLLVIDLATRAVVRDLPLGGQPDSVAISPDHRFIAIAIENQRNEAHVPAGGAAGEIPQLPGGYLAVIETRGAPASWVRTDVDLTGLASIAPSDPEPEFVDINRANEAVVTLQENNHVVIVHLPSRQVVADFPAGTVNLDGVDAIEDGVIAQDDQLDQVRREPDAVKWLGRDHLVTANEGDYAGGSRGFTIFRRDGTITYDSGSSLEQLAVRYGHYPEGRSEDKGVEPESVAAARFGPEDYVFVASERGGFVAVFRLDREGQPEFSQRLPAPLRPEGLLAIPHRNLLIASGESDAQPFGVRSTVMIYELGPGGATAPQVESADDSATGLPIPWSALSGLTEVPGRADTCRPCGTPTTARAGSSRSTCRRTPALITSALTLTTGGAPATGLDPEGLADAPDGTIWVASEGNDTDTRQNRLLQVDARQAPSSRPCRCRPTSSRAVLPSGRVQALRRARRAPSAPVTKVSTSSPRTARRRSTSPSSGAGTTTPPPRRCQEPLPTAKTSTTTREHQPGRAQPGRASGNTRRRPAHGRRSRGN